MPIVEATAHGGAEMVEILRRFNDVTERLRRSHDALAGEVGRLRDELRRKDRELQRRERLAALGEMAAGVAHEIRNPLGGIRLYASLLERDLADRPRQADLVRKMDDGARHLEAIVNDILAFSRGAEPAVARVRLGELLDNVLGHVAHRAEPKGVRVHVAPETQDIDLLCDAGQIERALVNLTLNAIEAVDAGGNVWIGGEPRRVPGESGLYFDIRVEDDGPGIPPENLQRVFHPFFTTRHSGTGLGLAIVHRIAEANGGFVRAGHRPGGGAAFVLSTPRADDWESRCFAGGVEFNGQHLCRG